MKSVDNALPTRAKKKLLVVCDEMEVGGSQRQIVNLVKNIDRRQFEPHLLYFRKHSYLLEELHASGVRVTHIPKHFKIDPLFLLGISRFLWRERFDHIHCFSLTAEFWCCVAYLFSPKTNLHTSIRARYEWFTSTEWLLKRFITHMSKSVVSNSHSGSEYALQKMPGLAPKLATIYNGVVKQDQSLLPIEGSPQHKDKPLGLFVGRLVKSKNVPVILQALEILKQKDHDFHFLIAGSGPEEKDIRQEIGRRGLRSNVQMIGERTDIHALLNHSDFLILPSEDEGISNT